MMATSRLWSLVAALVVILVAGSASARPAIAVLEYRAGARGAMGLGARFATVLGKSVAADVITIDEARRRVGPKLDAEVARCGMQVPCLAGIGGELQATEILLVGVSQLGDVVVSLQRIDVARGELAGRHAETVAPDAELSDAELLGWLKRLFPPDYFVRYGELVVSSNLEDSRVLVNGIEKGRTPLDRGLRLRAPSSYRLRVDHPGYVPFEARVDLVPDGRMEVRATLVRAESATPVYKRWYLWASIGAAAVIVGGAVGIYFGTRVDPQPRGELILPPRPQ